MPGPSLLIPPQVQTQVLIPRSLMRANIFYIVIPCYYCNNNSILCEHDNFCFCGAFCLFCNHIIHYHCKCLSNSQCTTECFSGYCHCVNARCKYDNGTCKNMWPRYRHYISTTISVLGVCFVCLMTMSFTPIINVCQTNSVLQSVSADIVTVLFARCMTMVHAKRCNRTYTDRSW